MASQKREKEETELKVPICTLPQTIQTTPHLPLIRSPDPNICDPRISSANPPEKQEEEEEEEKEEKNKKCLKRGRDQQVTRCSGSGCRKRIGLMGFRCRCGEMFCSDHRYSDRHDCTYDYKAAGRELIARENPLVRAAKLLKV